MEVALSYVDVWGKTQEVDPETRAALLKALGPKKSGLKKNLLPRPQSCYQPEFLERGGRTWGFAVQLYGLRSARNWGIGDFGDLRALIETSAALGAGLVGLNPLHAAHLSPYSPSSRHALNPLYIDVEALPEFSANARARRLVASRSFQARLKKLRGAKLVDYEGVRRAKHEVFESLFPEGRNRGPHTTFALFEALAEKFGGNWQEWPREYRHPRSAAVGRFARANARRVGFHAWLQRRAREQLDAAQKRALELGMPVGLYVDLALGADRGGAEVWSDQGAYALSASSGAPPDGFNPRGQDWGLPPYSPRALRARNFRPFAELLRANMPEGGALRIDHVMSLARLYWIPLGAKPDRGGYVSYPLRELLAVLAAESRKRRCLVIGEDLGTVPAELRAALAEAGVLSYRPLIFARAAPRDFPRDALACVSTHDLPTWRGYWAARDLELRERIGLTVDSKRESRQRKADQASLTATLRREGLDRTARSAHAFLARTLCKLVAVQPEDVLGALEQANLPGTITEHPNWRRKLPLALERWSADARFAALRDAFGAGKPIADPARRR